MERCCICNKKAEYYHHGSWWCEKHSHYYKEYGSEEVKESIDGSTDREGISGGETQIELGLNWI